MRDRIIFEFKENSLNADLFKEPFFFHMVLAVKKYLSYKYRLIVLERYPL